MVSKISFVTRRLLFYVAIASIGSIIYGWEVGMVNILFSMRGSFGNVFGLYNFNPMKKTFEEDEYKNLKEMIITPSFHFGGILGSIVVLFILDRIGRIRSLEIGAIIYFVGGLIQTFCSTIYVLCIGRFISGIASAIALCVCSLFISEIAPKEIRGTLGIVNSLGLQAGMFFASLCDTLCLKLIDARKNPNTQWRVAVGAQLVPAALFLLFVWFLPETPRYLLMKNKDDKALSNLAKVRQKEKTDEGVAAEFNAMSSKLKVELADGICSWREIVTTKSILYRVIIVSILQLLHMLVGVNAIGFYSTQIYSKYLDIPPEKYGAWLATLSNVISFVCSFPAMRYIENFGRRPLLKWGAFLLGLCMVAIYALCHLCDSTHIKTYGWICVIIIYIFGIVYSWSWSSAVFVFQSELFPLRMRTKANTVGGIFQFIGSIIVGGVTPTLLKNFKYYTFLIFAGFCLIAFIFTHFCVRETRGIPLEDMDTLYGDSSINDRDNFKKQIDECFNNVKDNTEDVKNSIKEA